MRKIDVKNVWLSLVGSNYSNSTGTKKVYDVAIRKFCDYAETTLEKIYTEWKETENTRDFIEKYKFLVAQYIDYLREQGYSSNTIKGCVNAIKSFFKYMDMPFTKTIRPRQIEEYHNRDIQREEIAKILKHCKFVRDRAFYSFMVSSGLRPFTIAKLKYKHMQQDFEDGVVPCKVDVPIEITKGKRRGHFTFINAETVEFLKDYLETRGQLTREGKRRGRVRKESLTPQAIKTGVLSNLVYLCRDLKEHGINLMKFSKPIAIDIVQALLECSRKTAYDYATTLEWIYQYLH